MMDSSTPVLTQTEQAVETLRRQQEGERELARVYARVFGTKEGQVVLADLCGHFPHGRPRIDAMATKANPLASLIGGIHFDGSAAVVKYVLDRIESARVKADAAEAAPVVVGP